MANSAGAIFVDRSVFLDYCCLYRELSEYAQLTLEELLEREVDLTVGNRTSKQFGRQIANRQAMLKHLFEAGKEYCDRDDLSESDFISEILVLSDIQKQLPYGLKEDYELEIESLRELVEDIGLESFYEEIYEMLHRSRSLQERIELRMISDRFDRGSKGHWDVEAFLKNEVGTIRANTILNAVYWQRKKGNEYFLVSGGDDIYVQKKNINEILEKNLSTNDGLLIFSSKDVVDEYGLSS